MSTPHFAVRPHASIPSTADAWLLRGYDTAIALLLFAAPLVMGGRHPAGRLVFVVLAFLAAAIWCGRQALRTASPWRSSAAQWILAAAATLVMLQLVPLPEGVHRLLSPQTSEVLPLWTSSAEGGFQLGSWNTLSLAPYETRIGLLVFLGYAAVFLTTCQRIASREDIEQMLRLVAYAACAMAVLGIAQYLFGNGKFLWIYHHPFRDADGVQGPFVNRNHFVQFLAVGLGPLLYLVYRELNREQASKKKRQRGFRSSQPVHDRWQLYLAGGMLLITLFAGLLSLSRGGILAVACVLAVCFALALWKRLLDRGTLLIVGVTGAVVMIALGIHGMGSLTDRMETLGSLDDDNSAYLRLIIWEANWQAASQFPLTGLGAGTHTEFYQLYLDADTNTEFTHAENGYVQVLSENGVIGLGLLLAGIALIGHWAFRALASAAEPRQAAIAAATVASLAAPLVHGAIDFVWWIPACMTPALLLLACLWNLQNGFEAITSGHSGEEHCDWGGRGSRRAETLKRDRNPQSAQQELRPPAQQELRHPAQQELRPPNSPQPSINWQWAAASLAGFGLALAAGVHLWGPARGSSGWDQYLAVSLATRSFRADARPHGATALLGQLDPESPAVVSDMAAHLEHALKHDPANPRLNARMASIRLQQFGLAQQRSENPMGLAMIRDAALASRFKSRREQNEWLATALGENLSLLSDALTHARRAVAGSPLQGEVYAHLAELSFLESPRAERKSALVDQAVLARPYSGDVLFAAGREAAIAGKHERAIDLLQQAFHAERSTQKLVIELIAMQTSVEEFVEVFKPDLVGIRMLREQYEAEGIGPAVEQATELLAERAMQEAEQLEGSAASVLYLEASRMWIALQRPQDAAASAALAVRASPLDFDARSHWARCLMATGHYKEAQKQWRWCITRRPADDYLRQQLADAKQKELAACVSVQVRLLPAYTGYQCFIRAGPQLIRSILLWLQHAANQIGHTRFPSFSVSFMFSE